MNGVNFELWPWVHMSFPDDMSSLSCGSAGGVPLRTTLFCSVLRFFGVVPFDLHWLAFEEITEGSGFEECSTTLMHKYWRHTRKIVIDDEVKRGGSPVGITVMDRVRFSPRVPLIGSILLPIVRIIFEHRHYRLRGKFGGSAV